MTERRLWECDGCRVTVETPIPLDRDWPKSPDGWLRVWKGSTVWDICGHCAAKLELTTGAA